MFIEGDRMFIEGDRMFIEASRVFIEYPARVNLKFFACIWAIQWFDSQFASVD